MNVDKFKNITPDTAIKTAVVNTLSETDGGYIASLSKLKPQKRSKKWLVILLETAAAVAIVTAVSLWAIIGRGIRIGNETPVDRGENENAPVYTVVYSTEENRAVYGANELQAFFDDYISEKACELRLFKSDGKADGVYIGYTSHFTVNADGSGKIRYISDGDTGIDNTVHGVYCFATEYVDFDKLTFLMSRADNKWYMSYGDGGYNAFAPDCIVNKYDNGDRVYDSERAEAVTVQNGIVTGGEQSLSHFASEFTANRYAEVNINGEYYSAIRRMKDISITADSGLVSFRFGERTFLELTQSEIERLGILYNPDRVKIAGKGEILNVDDPTSLIKALKESEQVQYKTHLEKECEYTVRINDWFSLCLYDDDKNAVIDGTVGFLYSYNTYPLAMRVSDALMLELEHLAMRVPFPEALDEQTAALVVSLAQEYRFDYLPDFDSADKLSYEDVINYAYAMNGFPLRLTTKSLNETTDKMLGVIFDVRDDYYVTSSVEGFADYGRDVKKLVSFKMVEGGNIEAEFESYQPSSEAYPTDADKPYRAQKVTYIPDADGFTPIRILSNIHGSINEAGERVYGEPVYNPEYAKRWGYLRDALDEYFEGTGEIDEYHLRNLKFYGTPDENGTFVFSFIGDIKPKPEYAKKYNADEDGWVYTYWLDLRFEETKDGITCLGEVTQQ